MDGLTRAQRDVLVAITRHWATHGTAPTFREVVEVCQFSSTNAVTVHAATLVRKGYLHPDTPLRPVQLTQSIRTIAAELVRKFERVQVV